MGTAARAHAGVPQARPKPRRPIPWRRVLAGVVAISLGAATAYGYDVLCTFEQRPLTLRGVSLPHGDPAPFVRELARSWLDEEVSVDCGSRVVRASRRDMGADVDVEGLARAARLARGHAPLHERALAYFLRPELQFEGRVHGDRVRGWVEQTRRDVSIVPEAVRRDGTGGRPGVAPNLEASVEAVALALESDAIFVSLPILRIDAPRRPVQSAAHAIFRQVLSSYETRYARGGESANRAVNVELASSLLDGAILAPSAELSFNEIVGERTYPRGFLPATELDRGGRRVDGIGGGVCQVAATLHAAAFFGGLEIAEHHPHTRNSSYIEPGLDAAVSWPGRDVRIRNPYEFSVRVRSSAYQGRLRIELMGARRAPRVEWSTRVVSRTPRGLERELDPGLPMGTEDVVDEGEEGCVVERTRTIHWPEGAQTDTVELHYPNVSRLVRVGPASVQPRSASQP